MKPSGTRAVIVGNGGSVDLMPPEFWTMDCLYIGTNRALCMKAMQGVRLDAVVIRDTYGVLWAESAVGWHYHQNYWKPCGAYKVGPSFARYTYCDEFVRQEDGWQFSENRDHNREAAVMRNGSVIIMAANVAFHWGVREFFVTGIDYHGRHAAMLDGYDVNTGNAWVYDKPVDPIIEKQFRVMREAVESTGGRVWNCSQGSKLQALEFHNGDFSGEHSVSQRQSRACAEAY